MIKAENFDINDYLKRIGFTAEISINRETLFGIVSSQLQSVPFENISVQKGKVPSLVPEDIVKKIVHENQGGYCYEVNGLLAMALGSIGFPYRIAAARPMTYSELRPRTHMVLVVEADGQEWLCDAGFGGYGLREPLALGNSSDVTQGDDRYRIEKDERGEFILSTRQASGWENLYGFFSHRQDWIEFKLGNYFNATHPDTIFTQKKLGIIQTKTGRIIIVDQKVRVIDNGNPEEFEMPYEDAIRKYFGIESM